MPTTAAAAIHGRINPTMSVMAYFMAPVAGDVRRTRLPLVEYPDVAAWLLTVLDYIMSVQGRLPGERRIAEPPGGAARQALIDGGVILVQPRPDGGLALRLNPEFDLRLEVNARRQGAPACNTQLALAQEPELARWLLAGHATAARPPGALPANPVVLDGLRRCGGVLDGPPPEDACFPDPAAPVDLGTELAAMARVFPQAAGAPIPAEVRRVLGRHTPLLPPGAAIVWAQDAGTGMVYPVRWDADVPEAELGRLAGRDAARRAAAWDRQREAARRSFREQGFAVLRELVPPAQRSALRRYVRQLRSRGYFPELDDGQVALRASIHNEPTIAALHNGLAGVVNGIGVEPVMPSYSFLSCYEEGAVLDRHLDRPQCRYNVCFVLDMEYVGREGEPEPWPIYLELEGRPVPALMQVGDGVFFSGASIWHWRDALPAGRRVVVCFSHYVPVGYTGSLD